MNKTQVLYLVFGIVLLLALAFDLGLLSRRNKKLSVKDALLQTFFWIALSLAFGAFIWWENEAGSGKADAVSYLTAYLLEWSLSLDNIFVFIIIFSFFRVKENDHSRVLLLGILMAVIFRAIFITLGSGLVARFGWILYLFGSFLVFTGFKMFSRKGNEFEPGKSSSYKLLRRIIPVTEEPAQGRFFIRTNGKVAFTMLAMVVLMLGLTDIVFALDSIPAVFSVIPDPSKKLLIFSSNIFAVLGLRSLFFLLRGAAERFAYLQQGVAAVLLFIGTKMLLPALSLVGVHGKFMHLPGWLSLVVIVVCVVGSIGYSAYRKNHNISINEQQKSS